MTWPSNVPADPRTPNAGPVSTDAPVYGPGDATRLWVQAHPDQPPGLDVIRWLGQQTRV